MFVPLPIPLLKSDVDVPADTSLSFCLHFTCAKPGSWEKMNATIFVKMSNSPVHGIWGNWSAVPSSSDSACEEFQLGQNYKVKIKKQKVKTFSHYSVF